MEPKLPSDARRSVALPARTPFFRIEAHGAGAPLPLRGFCVLLSQLPAGRSILVAEAPTVDYVLSGEALYAIDGRTRRVRAGEFLLIEAGTAFAMQTGGPAQSLRVTLGAIGNGASREPLALGRVLAGRASDPLSALLGRHACLLAERPEAGPRLARRIVAEVTVGVDEHLAAFAGRLERLGALKRSTRIETLHRLERARALIHACAGRALTLEAIAGEAALSRFHLSRSFASVYGLPPLAYHRRLRLEQAAERLRRESAPAAEIALSLGYGSLSAFTRAYRQQYGAPPSRNRLAAAG